MKSDFLLAITQLSAEKNLSKDVVMAAVESALASAYRKNNFAPIQCKLPGNGFSDSRRCSGYNYNFVLKKFFHDFTFPSDN